MLVLKNINGGMCNVFSQFLKKSAVMIISLVTDNAKNKIRAKQLVKNSSIIEAIDVCIFNTLVLKCLQL